MEELTLLIKIQPKFKQPKHEVVKDVRDVLSDLEDYEIVSITTIGERE